MKSAKTYIFDAIVNLLGQSILFFVGAFVWVNIAAEILWALCAVGFAAFLSVMERGAELRRGADFRHYMLFSVLPVNIAALAVAAVSGVIEYNIWAGGAVIYVYNPLYPIGIALGTLWITAAFATINRLMRREA